MSVDGRAADQTLPGYVLRECIGTGAASEVFRAERVGRPGSVVAVKRLSGSIDAEAVRSLEQEADILLALDHPSLVRLIDIVSDGEGVALVLGYAAGGSLADRRRTGSLPPGEVADIGARIGAALAVVHDAGLVHGDIKPANILFDAEQQPLLADLGAARFHHERGPVVGTPDHLAPEVLAGQPPDVRADVYALGITLREAVSDPPEALARVIDAAVDPDPARRPATAAMLAGQLDEARRMLDSYDLDSPSLRTDECATTDATWSPPTQRFGPLPPPPRVEAGPGLVRRTLALAGITIVVLTPLVIASWLVAAALAA